MLKQMSMLVCELGWQLARDSMDAYNGWGKTPFMGSDITRKFK